MDIIRWYEKVCEETAVYPGKGTLSLEAVTYCVVGLGEVGEVQGKLKKVLRGDVTLEEQRIPLLEELGDVLWYATRLANELEVSLAMVMELNAKKLRDRKERGVIRGSGDNR